MRLFDFDRGVGGLNATDVHWLSFIQPQEPQVIPGDDVAMVLRAVEGALGRRA
jgi:hypothetical protein